MNLDLGSGSRAMWAKRLGRQAAAFLREDAGVTAIEYALLGALIAVVIASSVGLAGAQLNILWTAVSDAVSEAVQ